MPVEAAARVEDEIAHGFGLAAMVGGALIGAVAGVALVSATALTGGLAAVAIAGAVAGGGLAGGQIMSGLKTIFELPDPTTGVLTIGSPGVSVNKRKAIRADLSSASSCTGLPFNHPWWPAPVPVREGSASVSIDKKPASRLKSKLMCGAHIKTASPNVFIGGETVQTGFIFDLEAWTRTGLEVLGLAALVGAGVFAAAAGLAAFGVFAGVGALGYLGLEGVGQIGDALGPGYRDLLQGVVGMGLVVGSPKLASMGKNARARAIAERDLGEMMRRAPAAKAEIDGVADDVARQVGGTVAKAPIKSQARALEKVMNDYDGDASRIKDLARNTVIVPEDKIPQATQLLREQGVAIKEITPSRGSLGYSGVNGTMKTGTGLTGEIQVNSPEMIYAKESPANARAILGAERYDAIAERVGVPGGRGHALYEQHRSLPLNDPARTAIENESMEYYDLVRGR
ncbi:PAAR domain-containing protein [Sphingomonas jatrophae]|uniref:PAAR motif-containing protein n=1 Tax=Sphingomonas jatrophae TaxID=1166337 RepID=A0A1I6M290_9SPHN|nr:PAAR domain-containing protein [Sphingomonas jatrophae]SFS09837.1 PAAR motif-containing protein [Sphingomonas jatrophae]